MARSSSAMRMRQSIAEWERAFVREITLDRRRRASLRHAAEQRTMRREIQRRRRRGSLRFALLVLALILTAVFVTVGMFAALYLLLG